MASAGGQGETFWELLADVARLQEAMGKDTVAWARVYDAAGQALQNNAETTALMAEVGRRAEQYLRAGPPAAARQAMQFFLNPLQALGAAAPGGPSGGVPAGPFARMWEAWAAAIPGAPAAGMATGEATKPGEGAG